VYTVQETDTHSDAFTITSRAPVLNASLLYVIEHLDDVIGPAIDQSTASLHLADEHLTHSELNVENIARTRNATRLALNGQLRLPVSLSTLYTAVDKRR